MHEIFIQYRKKRQLENTFVFVEKRTRLDRELSYANWRRLVNETHEKHMYELLDNFGL